MRSKAFVVAAFLVLSGYCPHVWADGMNEDEFRKLVSAGFLKIEPNGNVDYVCFDSKGKLQWRIPYCEINAYAGPAGPDPTPPAPPGPPSFPNSQPPATPSVANFGEVPGPHPIKPNSPN